MFFSGANPSQTSKKNTPNKKNTPKAGFLDLFHLLSVGALLLLVALLEEEEWLRKQPALWPSDNPKRQADAWRVRESGDLVVDQKGVPKIDPSTCGPQGFSF